MSAVQKYRRGGALHRRGPTVFYSPTGDPLRDAWNSGHDVQPDKDKTLATKRKLTSSKLSRSKLKLYYEIWKDSLVDASGNLIQPEDKEEVEDGVEAKEAGEEEAETQPPGVKPDLQYSREELYEIQKLSLSQVKPEFLDRYPIQARFSFVKGVWERNTSESGGGPGGSGAPGPGTRERWPRAVTPSETHDGYNDSKMRRGETRMSRGKEQQQDASLILSPQRRSFNSGCYITGGGGSTMGVRDGKTMDRDSMGQAQGRRFGGTGRVLPWADPGAEAATFVAPNLMPDYTQRRDGGSGAPPQAQLQQPGGGGMFDRRYGDNKRSNNRNSGDYNSRSNGDYHRNSGGEYNRNGGDYNNRNSGGDYGGGGGGRYNGMNGNDRRRNNSDRNHNSDLWDEPEWYSGGPTSQNDVIDLHGFQDEEKDEESPEKNRKSSSNSESERGHRKSSSSSSGGLDHPTKDLAASSDGRHSRTEERPGSGPLGDPLKFGPPGSEGPNLDDLLNNLDTFPDLLTNGTDAGGDTSGGGGSRFSRWFRKESPAPESSPSPHQMINDLINDFSDENRAPNSNRFTPISPVFSSQHPHRPHPSNATANFLDMMLKQQDSNLGMGGVMRSGSIRDLEGVGKLHSVEELEAKIRHTNPHAYPHSGNKEEDMANFKKLMMSKLLHQQQQLAQNLQHAQQLGGGGHHVPPGAGNPWGNLLAAQNNSNYQELVHKMVKIQQAQEYQRRMAQMGMGNNPQAGFLPPHHGTSPVPPEIHHHLLNNPQFDARNLIRLFQQRIPSPNQLAAHTQSILQNAIMKKKLEEQKEALRKRQELMQRASSPNSSGGPHHGGHPHSQSGGGASPPVLAAFTPTSVLRKMTAAPPHSSSVHEVPNSGVGSHEKEMFPQNHSQGGAGVPWSQLSSRPHPQQPSSLAIKNNLMNLGNQQISSDRGPALGPNPRSKFTLSSKPSSKSSAHMAQSLADQMNMMSAHAQELNLKSAAQHANPFTSHLASHHSQAGGGPAQAMASPADQLQKWFSPEFLARARSQGPPPAQNLLSVEELERIGTPRHLQGPPSNPTPGAPTGGPPPSAGAVQN